MGHLRALRLRFDAGKRLKFSATISYLGGAPLRGANILNFGMEMTMSDTYLTYLRREHARLDAEIVREGRQPWPDEIQIARLKKLKLAVKDQIAAYYGDREEIEAA